MTYNRLHLNVLIDAFFSFQVKMIKKKEDVKNLE